MNFDINTYTEAGKVALDSMKALSEINYGITTRLLQQQMELANIYFEGGAKQLNNLSETKDIKVLLEKQAGLTEEVGQKVLSNLQGSMEVIEGAKAQWNDWNEANLAKLQKAA